MLINGELTYQPKWRKKMDRCLDWNNYCLGYTECGRCHSRHEINWVWYKEALDYLGGLFSHIHQGYYLCEACQEEVNAEISTEY